MDSYLEHLQQVLESTTTGADPSQMSQAPAGKWNSAQILEHLYLTYRNTNRALGKCLEEGKPLATQAHLKHRVARFVLLTLGYFPSGAKTPERAAPKGMKLEEVKAAIVPEVQ